MKKYTPENPVFSAEFDIIERADLVNAQTHNASVMQLMDNEVALKNQLDSCIGSMEDGKPQFTDGIGSDNVVDAVNEVFRLGSEKKHKLVENLTAMGVPASTEETWEQLLDKVLDMTDTSEDTVTAEVLLAGYTAHDASGGLVNGMMADRGAWTGNTTGNGSVAVPAGYHDGNGYVSGGGAYNSGYSAGVDATKKGTAVPGDVLSGKTFTNAGSVGVTGTMPEKAAVTVDASAVTQDDTYTYFGLPEGHYSEDSKARALNSNIKPQLDLSIVAKPSVRSSKATFSAVVGGIYAVAAANGQSFTGATVLINAWAN